MPLLLLRDLENILNNLVTEVRGLLNSRPPARWQLFHKPGVMRGRGRVPGRPTLLSAFGPGCSESFTGAGLRQAKCGEDSEWDTRQLDGWNSGGT